MTSSVQYIRLSRDEPPTQSTQRPTRHAGILQDQLRRAARRPWVPSLSLAFRVFLLVRAAGAMYSNIGDSDEVYNFWEPLHFLNRGTGFQPWEASPKYAIRSWAYILLHTLPTHFVLILPLLQTWEKRPLFFAVRMFLAVICSLAEAKFYRTVAEKINERVGRYLFFMLLLSAGMWNASVAFLPSSFAMYMTMFAFSYALELPSIRTTRRTWLATFAFATGAIVGWPFALALGIPFVFEELFVFGADNVAPHLYTSWIFRRWKRLFGAGLGALLLFVPVVYIDTIAYGKLTFAPWNVVRYNIFGGAERGPNLYGTEPWFYYILNLILNFNILVPLSLSALPALYVTYLIDKKRLGFATPTANESSPFTLLALRLAPFHLWFVVLTLQSHKEERFMFPAYPLLCFNAAVVLYLMRGWQEALFIKLTASPYRASQSMIFARFTMFVIIVTGIISTSRILALWNYYHAPMTIAYKFETEELPRLLNVTGITPTYPDTPEDHRPPINLAPIKDFDLKLCLGKEWHRFPGSYLIPEGVSIEFVKCEYSGLLPGHFANTSTTAPPMLNWWPRPQTAIIPEFQNDLNKEEPSRYIPVETCDYIIDLDFPLHPSVSEHEPRYAVDKRTWERTYCQPFIDVRHSRLLTRAFWAPGELWQRNNVFGDYCLLKNRALVQRKEAHLRGGEP